ncbi:Neurotransmitter-gated ion-channel transmembrane domain [Trinorchestia longiramus]|nr:Neurotransmitter-gated ion-channel transmembrane domain [Trinorchestia longiramus]
MHSRPKVLVLVAVVAALLQAPVAARHRKTRLDTQARLGGSTYQSLETLSPGAKITKNKNKYLSEYFLTLEQRQRRKRAERHQQLFQMKNFAHEPGPDAKKVLHKRAMEDTGLSTQIRRRIENMKNSQYPLELEWYEGESPLEQLMNAPEIDYSYFTSLEDYHDSLITSQAETDTPAEEIDTDIVIVTEPFSIHNNLSESTSAITNAVKTTTQETKEQKISTSGINGNFHLGTDFQPLPRFTFNGDSTKLYGQNLAVFGHIDNRKFIRTIENCSSYTRVDLFSKYSMTAITSPSQINPLGQLVLYFNMMEVNAANYDIALERIKRIIDHFTMTYQGLAFYSILHSNEGKDRTDFYKKETDFHWELNDAVMAYCSMDYPRCHIVPDLSTIMKGLNASYVKDQTLEEYESKTYARNNCEGQECLARDIVLETRPTLSDLTPEVQLEKFSQVFCQVSYHRVVEFTSKLPGQEEFSPDPTTPTPRRSSDQVGLVLNDILPLDLKQYDKNQPPRFDGQATIVYFHVTVLSVDSINEESMTYVTDIFLAQSWRDHRLRLPENMTEEYRILDVEWLHRMWRPDCFFKNAKRVTFHEMSVPNHYLCQYLKFSESEQQNNTVLFYPVSHTTHDLIFKWNETDPLVVNPDIELPQLDISRNNTEDCTLNYSTGNFTCLAVVFNLRRRLGYHLFHTYVPSALTVVMSWISFWIKPEAIPARVTLGVTSLLTLATQNQQSQSSLPPVSYIKAIDVWMSSCTVFVFASLLQFGVVNHFMNEAPITKDMTSYSVEDIPNYDERKMSEEVGLTGRSHSRSRSRMRGRSPSIPQYVVTRCSGKDIAIYIDRFSRYFFPLSFMVLNISYWTVYGFL